MSIMSNKLEILKMSLKDGKDTAIKKSKTFIEYSDLSLSISACKKEIDEIYRDIGEKVYNNYKKGENITEKLNEFFESIKDLEEEEKKLKKKILKLQDRKECKYCGRSIYKRAKYCEKCGKSQ